MTRPTRDTTAGCVYLDLRKKARAEARGTDELLGLAITNDADSVSALVAEIAAPTSRSALSLPTWPTWVSWWWQLPTSARPCA